MRFLKNNLHFRLFLLILLAVLPGTLLTIYSLITREPHEILVILLIGATTISGAWFAGNILIIRNVQAMIKLAKRLSAGDLSARSGLTDRFGLLGELARAYDQMASSLEDHTKQIEQHANQVSVLIEMASDFALQQDLPTLLQLIMDRGMAMSGASRAMLSLRDPQRGDLEIVAVRGFQVAVGTRVRAGVGAIGIAALDRQTVVIGQDHSSEDPLFKFETNPLSLVMQVPMVYRGELLGVLGLAESEPGREYSQAEIHLITLFVELATSAIQNTRLFDETRRHLLELEAINEVSTTVRVAQTTDEMLPRLLNHTMKLVRASIGSIWLFEPAVNSLRQVVSNGLSDLPIYMRPGEGIIGRVFTTGELYFTLNWREDPFTPLYARPLIPAGSGGAFIPIRTAQAIVGVLFIGFSAPQTFTTDQIRLVTTIAEIAGNTIHRMQLHEQMRSQLQRLSALHRIDLAITNSLDLANTLQALLDQVITQLAVDAACVLVFNPYEQTLEFAAGHGFNTDALRRTRLHMGEGYAGRAALEKRTVYIADLKTRQTDFLRSPLFAAEGFMTYYAVPLSSRSHIKGVLEIFHRSVLENGQEWLDFLEALASQAAIAIEDATLFNDLQRSNAELNQAYNSTLEGWSRALDLRDRETEGHSQRVTELTLRLAKAMEVSEPNLVHIRRGALLHDIGKLSIPDSILLKPGPLSEAEMEMIRKHPVIAYELLAPIAYLRQALEIPYDHHERWDGSGYPRGLKGEEIPLSARIFAVVDVWDALLSDRPYRKGWPEEKVRAYLQEQAGRHFDPQVVFTFFSLLSNENIRHNAE